jgi:hypothetical protein
MGCRHGRVESCLFATITAVAMSCCLACPAWAYRPFTGTDAAIAEPGAVELEFGPIGLHREGPKRLLVAPALVANYGICSTLEAVFEGQQEIQLGSVRLGNRYELADTALLLKWISRQGSLQGRSGVSVAIESGALLPSTAARMGFHLASIVSMRWPELTLHLNLANDWNLPMRYAASASLILEGVEMHRLRPVAEMLLVHESREMPSDAQNSASLLVGMIHRWSDTVAFDWALRGGKVARQMDEELRVGVTWAFEVALPAHQ